MTEPKSCFCAEMPKDVHQQTSDVDISTLTDLIGALQCFCSLPSALSFLLPTYEKQKSPPLNDAVGCVLQLQRLLGQAQRKCQELLTSQKLLATNTPAIEQPLESVRSDSGAIAQESKQQQKVWSGFYNKTLKERLDLLALMFPDIFTKQDTRGSTEGPSRAFLSSPHANPASPVFSPDNRRQARGSPIRNGLSALGSDDPVESLKFGANVKSPPSNRRLPSLGSQSEVSPFSLPRQLANLMVENCVGVLGIPLGLGLNFVIDGVHRVIPMATEEPSVIAAASGAAKLISTCGGFETTYTGSIMTCQIHMLDVESVGQAVRTIEENKTQLLDLANTHCASMKKRGGGAVDIYCRILYGDEAVWYPPRVDRLAADYISKQDKGKKKDGEFPLLVVHIDVDVQEAMGANIVNTVAEGVSKRLAQLCGGRCGLRILTNLCSERMASASFSIPVSHLKYKGVDGMRVAERIVEASNFARDDPFRACTNNKGIMNGIDAIAMATGQDFRAVESAAHAYAARSGRYTSLTSYHISEVGVERALVGSLTLPLALGTKGGSLRTHPGYLATHTMLGNPDVKELSGIFAAVGLAQNFAAVRALAVTGIQAGHMTLHARNIAVASGSPTALVPEVCQYMLSHNRVTVEAAQEYLRAHFLFTELQKKFEKRSNSEVSSKVHPSTLYIELPVPHLEQHIAMNVAFESLGKLPTHLAIVPRQDETSIPSYQTDLLGDKGYNKLAAMFTALDRIRVLSPPSSSPQLETEATPRTNLVLQNKLKLTSILINVITCRLVDSAPALTRSFLLRVLQHDPSVPWATEQKKRLFESIPPLDPLLSLGLPLLISLLMIFEYLVEQEVHEDVISKALIEEQRSILAALAERAAYSAHEGKRSKAVSLDISSLSQRSSAENISEGTFSHDMSFHPITTENADELSNLMSWHAKRWQATLFLLVDCLSLEPNCIEEHHLDSLRACGRLLEWEGTAAHDVARWERSSKDGLPNIFLAWLFSTSSVHTPGDHKGSSVKDVDQTLTLTEEQREIVDGFVPEFVSQFESWLKPEKDSLLLGIPADREGSEDERISPFILSPPVQVEEGESSMSFDVAEMLRLSSAAIRHYYRAKHHSQSI